jgi:hypothetical protein
MAYNYKYITKNLVKSLLATLLILLFYSCIVVKKEILEEELPSNTSISQKPEIMMSEQIIRSKSGDMIALLPKDWFFVDVSDKASTDIFAMAVNSDYTLGAIFTNLKKFEISDEIINKEGLLGLARLSFERHQKKTAGTARQVGKYNTIQIGTLSFSKYEFALTAESPTVQSAVFMTDFGQYYEFALMPMNITGKPIPDKLERERIFRSILTSVQY